jgi:hypothetical protein
MAYTVAANGAFLEAQAKARKALVSLAAAANPPWMPAGSNGANMKAGLDAAKTAADAVITALSAATAAVVPPPAVIITPAIGYGSMTGAPGVAVAPNP